MRIEKKNVAKTFARRGRWSVHVVKVEVKRPRVAKHPEEQDA